MENPNIVHGLVIALIAMLPLYQLIGKRILYNIPIGAKYFYSEMIMCT